MSSRLEKIIMRHVTRAARDFNMIEPDDRIMVGVSGGKDSYTLLQMLRLIQSRAPFDFSIVAVTLDQGHPGFPADVLRRYYEAEGYEYQIVHKDTYSIVTEKIPAGQTFCSLCSRLRRGILYNVAQDLGATKIALGHHREDLIETLMLNILYSGQLKSMPPRLRSDDGRNTVIRPLAYCPEELIVDYSAEVGFPIIPCDLCGSQENLHRQKIKALIGSLHEENPKVKGNMLAALSNVRPSHLLDGGLFDHMGSAVGTDEAVL